jgi:DNA-directed RNA polymerase specialized sigma24 family protein
MLRFFAGLTVEDTAAALNSSPATVKRDWNYARAWLHDAMNGMNGEGGTTADDQRA